MLAATPAPLHAQLAPRLSAQVSLDELSTATAALPADPALASLRSQLQGMADELRQDAGKDADKPADLVGDALRGRIVRAHAAATRVQAYLKTMADCQGADRTAMQSALAESVKLLAAADGGARAIPAVEDVQSMPVPGSLFAIRAGGGPLAFALTGSDLFDSQCPSPRVSVTDAGGTALANQPILTGASPARLELKWADVGQVPVGPVVLHVVAQRKVFLLGCQALPEATAVIAVVPATHYRVDYALEAICPAPGDANRVVALGKGTLELAGGGASAAQNVPTTACAEPAAYRLSASVSASGGAPSPAGPFTQSAQASITAGLPGGLTLSWDPSVQSVFVRAGANTCKGVR
ncbi:hypothetical protein ATSB10_15910 [Dyella thiooxydans]|uniref:Uncharacterized protein n=2 Tax=Dyella thiooxydans TaxID=445710 RepID=A0A161J2F6_9GAMM|nr:hypothetical protein ATSB10_15910 [Dyella thiooxydans]